MGGGASPGRTHEGRPRFGNSRGIGFAHGLLLGQIAVGDAVTPDIRSHSSCGLPNVHRGDQGGHNSQLPVSEVLRVGRVWPTTSLEWCAPAPSCSGGSGRSSTIGKWRRREALEAKFGLEHGAAAVAALRLAYVFWVLSCEDHRELLGRDGAVAVDALRHQAESLFGEIAGGSQP